MRRRIAATLLSAAAAHAPAADALGTLFHTPQERERLDRLRRGEVVEAPAGPTAKRAPTLTGFVKRSDGRNTVWLDGKPLTGPAAAIPIDPAKARDPRFPDRPAIEIRRTR